jgi:hypothetical protein
MPTAAPVSWTFAAARDGDPASSALAPADSGGLGPKESLANGAPATRAVKPEAGPTRAASDISPKDKRKEAGPLVLNQFVLKREGVKLQVIDADGSVYEGALGQAEAERLKSVQDRLDELIRSGGTNELAAKPPRTIPSLAEGAVSQPVFFRAAGLNRTLNQPVELAGVLSAVGEANREELGKWAEPSGEMAKTVARSAPGRAAQATAPPAALRTEIKDAEAFQGGPLTAGTRRAPSTNAILLQGRFRVGTNAEQPLKAMRVR